jgi:hypothetical protein
MPRRIDPGGLLSAILKRLTAGSGSTAEAADTDPLRRLEREIRAGIPPGSADHAHVSALATLYRRGDLDFNALQERIIALRLPPHPQGDGYLLISPPPPPPGVTFDPRHVPIDWEGNWGVVAGAMFLGLLTREEYERLHAAAHPDCALR